MVWFECNERRMGVGVEGGGGRRRRRLAYVEGDTGG